MKATLHQLITEAVQKLQAEGLLPNDVDFTPRIKLDATKDAQHGDFATNLALVLAKPAKLKPAELAAKLIEAMPEHQVVKRTEVAGPGFINFFVDGEIRASAILQAVLDKEDKYGTSDEGTGKKVLLEYVSANPTGPLHVGHGRGAAFGASLAKVLEAAGYEVTSEYYVNDAGRQMDILALSVWMRYLELGGETVNFPGNAYQGDYVRDIASDLQKAHADKYIAACAKPNTDDVEEAMDAAIEHMKATLGEDGFKLFHQAALNAVLEDIKEDLSEFGVDFDVWFSEQSLFDNDAINQGIEALQKAGTTYEKEGALWFKATDFGDEKDRVLRRANGQTTYFASDVAYHWDKYRRGYDIVMDLFGADHHGYISRLKASVKALGHDERDLQIFMVQFAILYRQGERVQMSTRSGSFVTLRELRDEVGRDAARFFYVMRKPEQHMDFDLDLAKAETRDNPVYYVQYAHARIASVFGQLDARDLSFDAAKALEHVHLLTEEHEQALISLLDKYPAMVALAARTREPHQVAYYLRELANGLHAYYNAISLLCDDEAQRNARLLLIHAVQIVLKNGLELLGVSAPRSM